jgi:hypothetical protein
MKTLTLALTLLLAGTLFAKDAPRGKKKLLAFAAVLTFTIVAASYDAHETLKGLKLGVGVEGNTWLVGSHPSARALYGRDVLQIGLITTPSALAYVFRKWPFYYAGLAGPAAFGAKSIQGGRSWIKFEHPALERRFSPLSLSSLP